METLNCHPDRIASGIDRANHKFLKTMNFCAEAPRRIGTHVANALDRNLRMRGKEVK